MTTSTNPLNDRKIPCYRSASSMALRRQPLFDKGVETVQTASLMTTHMERQNKQTESFRAWRQGDLSQKAAANKRWHAPPFKGQSMTNKAIEGGVMGEAKYTLWNIPRSVFSDPPQVTITPREAEELIQYAATLNDDRLCKTLKPFRTDNHVK